MDVLLQTIQFASEAHRDQRRKDPYETPYVNHLISVANYIVNIGKVTDVTVLQAAILHDLVEDIKEYSIDDVTNMFGSQVSSIVSEVTDDKSLSKVERKRLQVENAPKKSVGAKLVKLADKLHNCSDLLINPPVTWTKEYIKGYFVWSWYVVNGLRGTNEYLENALDEVFSNMIKEEIKDKEKMGVLLEQYYSMC